MLRGGVVRWLGTGLIALGLSILVVTIGFYGYSQYEEQQAQQEVAAMGLPEPNPAPTAATSANPTMQPWPRQVAPWATAMPRPTAMPTAIPNLPADRIRAPSIGLDSRVVESLIVDGEWTVPKFVAGHLQGTANPLQGSNVALAGHIESISSGNVFANIGKLKPGDPIQLYTSQSIVNYKVSQVRVVANNDLSVVQPTHQEQVTLITCTGTWLPLQRDYNQRLVVIAKRVAG